MTRALFVTTHTNDTHNHIDAWDSVAPRPADRIAFNYNMISNDGAILAAAKKSKPDVIFYVGACNGSGLPKSSTFRELRGIAPLINLVSDAADPPWHHTIRHYREKDCFDLHVGIDGDPAAPCDLVTLTPVDFRKFEGKGPSKDIRCGFSGNASGKRARLLGALGSRVWVRVRGDDYEDHVNFLRRCRLIFNTSYTGSGQHYHVKGRVLEAGWAGGALLEHAYSPMETWFGKSDKDGGDCYLTYEDEAEAISIVDKTPDDVLANFARNLQESVRTKFHPAMIYGEILEKVNVDNTLTIKAS